MKIAILISGQARNFDKGYEELKKAYLDRYDCDIFYNVWNDPEPEATQFFANRPKNKYDLGEQFLQELKELYNPKDHTSQVPMVFDEHNIVDPVWRQPLQNTMSMFWSLREAFYLAPKGYDFYVRTRFDLRYEESTLDLEELDPEKLHVWEWDTDIRVRHRGYYDVFAIGNYDNIGIYSTPFVKIPWYLTHDEDYIRFLEGDSKLRNEYLLRWHLTTSGVQVQEHPTQIPHADGQIIR